MGHIASNLHLSYLYLVLAFDSLHECECFLTGLGKYLNSHFFFSGCKLELLKIPEAGAKIEKVLMCRDSLPAIKKAPLKIKKCNK